AGERVMVSVNRRVISQHFHAHHNPISKSTAAPPVLIPQAHPGKDVAVCLPSKSNIYTLLTMAKHRSLLMPVSILIQTGISA
ncbi:hypothetical protein CYG45_13280, partial [Lacticaseibacillus rhamnosus]